MVFVFVDGCKIPGINHKSEPVSQMGTMVLERNCPLQKKHRKDTHNARSIHGMHTYNERQLLVKILIL